VLLGALFNAPDFEQDGRDEHQANHKRLHNRQLSEVFPGGEIKKYAPLTTDNTAPGRCTLKLVSAGDSWRAGGCPAEPRSRAGARPDDAAEGDAGGEYRDGRVGFSWERDAGKKN
jgi:hypothetical protein